MKKDNLTETQRVRALKAADFSDWLELNTAYLVEEGLPVQGTTAQRKAQFLEQTEAKYWWAVLEDNKLRCLMTREET